MTSATRLLNRLSIRGKLIAVSMCTTNVALLVAGAAFIANEYVISRDRVIARLDTLAGMVGGASIAAMSFDDPASARETLATLAVQAAVTRAGLLTPDGRTFAGYARAGTAPTAPLTPIESRRAGRVSLIWSMEYAPACIPFQRETIS